MEKNILILSGGTIDVKFLQDHLAKHSYDIVIAVDHGLVTADLCQLELDYLVGDFDSVDLELLKKYQKKQIKILQFIPEKDMTDTEIAIHTAMKEEGTSITLIGATGTRLDHTMANIHLLAQTLQVKADTEEQKASSTAEENVWCNALENCEVVMLDEKNKIYLKNKSFTIQKDKQYGSYVSLLPFAGDVCGLSLYGMKYPLSHTTLKPGISLGISNEIIDDIATIEFDSGILIVFETRD